MKLNCYSCKGKNISKICCALISKVYSAEERVLVLTSQNSDMENLDDLLWTYSDEFIPHDALSNNNEFTVSENLVFICTMHEYKNYNFAKHLIFFNLSDSLVEKFCENYQFSIVKEFLSISWIRNDFSSSYVQLKSFFTSIFVENFDINFYSKNFDNVWQKD